MKRMMLAALVSSLGLTGCVVTGDQYRSDVYSAYAVNQAQEVKTVRIIAVTPARVAVNNAEGKAGAQAVGAVLGALIGIAAGNGGHGPHRGGDRVLGGLAGGVAGGMLAGAATEGTTLVNGVQITFRYGNKLFNSAQVGRVCEYKVGTAIMVSPHPNETRIQPNNPGGCPAPKPEN